MSHRLELPEPIYDALSEAAMAAGTTPAGWIAAHLPAPIEKTPPHGAKTLADLFAGRIGTVASGGGVALSENCGEHFADDLERKRREGRL